MSSPRAPGRPDSLRPVIGAVVLLFFALLAAAGVKGYRDLTAARAHERQLLLRIDETRHGIERLRGRIERLRSDPATLERLARDQLGMVRPRDVVIELPPPTAGEPGPASPAAGPAVPGPGAVVPVPGPVVPAPSPVAPLPGSAVVAPGPALPRPAMAAASSPPPAGASAATAASSSGVSRSSRPAGSPPPR